MEMHDEFLEINDLDWFASCRGGVIAHFATGGDGVVPDDVRQSISRYEEIYDYFYSRPGGVDVEIVEANLVEFADEAQRARYLKSFVEMAGRGLFSHDASEQGGYKLIAKPKSALKLVDLPKLMQSSICKLPLELTDWILCDDFTKD
ncbi:hypothetical protein ACOYXF_12490 [Pseudomonas sp. Tul1A2]